VASDHQAAAAAQLLQGLGGDGAGGDVGVVDDRPDRLAPLLGRSDLGDLGGHPRLDDAEHLLDGAAGGGDAGP
jgi:hypothetical protein